MATFEQLTTWRDALEAARFRGLREVERDGHRIVYRSDAEMVAALADLNQRIAAAGSQQVRTVLIHTSKGV